MKVCKVCGLSKPLAEFHSRSAKCKPCHAAAGAKYRAEHKAELAAKGRAYREANADRIAAVNREYREKAGDARRQYQRQRYEALKHEYSERAKRYRETAAEALKQKRKEKYAVNREAAIQAAAEWARKNPEKARAKAREIAKRQCEALTDAYVRSAMRTTKDAVPAELVQMKRDEIALRRLARLLKEASNANEQND